ncbi:hypothetical protein [Mesorhizobium sp. M0203]|uniref:hypothetical protein n=1 Tax=Mesorhizobium sp. M0203 TaxID=2956912 RepID=UPI00333B5CFE
MSTSKPTEGTLDAKLERMLANWAKPAVRGVMLPGTQMTCDEAAAAIRAALTGTVAPVEAMAVKALEWFGNDPENFWSRGGLFTYTILHDGNEPDEWSMHRETKIISYCATEKDAIAAAQADYERLVRSALAPATLKKDEYVRGYVDGYKEGTLIDIDIASTSIAEMVADWYGNAPLPNARITAEVIAHRLARFAANPEAPAGRTVAWLIERKFPADGLSAPETRWYAENRLGFHWWTPTAAMAKRFTSKADVEAFNAYLMIDTDPTISITEHVFFGSLSEAPAAPVGEHQIKRMVDRFLGWKLPESFNPDAGISFKAAFNEHTNHPMKHEPSGTNLFDAVQAEAMVRYMLDGMPAAADGRKPYAHEYGRSNGDGTYSVVIERGEPKRPSPDWPIKPLYDAALVATPPAPTSAVNGEEAERIASLEAFQREVWGWLVDRGLVDPHDDEWDGFTAVIEEHEAEIEDAATRAALSKAQAAPGIALGAAT